MTTPFNKLLADLPEDQRKIIKTAVKRIVDRNVEDTKNRMVMIGEMRAGPLRLEAVEFEGRVTYTMCFDNDVMAHVGGEAAKLFCTFVTDTEARRNIGLQAS